jgi:hypothetical protein
MFARGWAFRLLAGMACGWALGWAAAPSLTTIQDTLYKADGTPFSGFLLIEWTGFQAGDATIATQHVTAPIVNGILHVQLVPNPAGSSYAVRYSSDGKIQFQEIWVVPASPLPVLLRDVRVATVPEGGGTEPPSGTGTIQEADVVGLVNDLAIRPVKGPSYAPSRAAAIDTMGALVAVLGDPGECVRVDGTAGPCGSLGPGFVDSETPAGLISGTNAVFTLADSPVPSTSLAVYRNGVLQTQGVDYALSGNVVTFSSGSIPQPGDGLVATYRLAAPNAPIGEEGGLVLGTEVITNDNVAPNAGIVESKLALNFPTHSAANDPTADQKAALEGTAGYASAVNRYVTNEDSRMSDARAPLGHGLLSAGHSDTVAAAPARGDLILGRGSSSPAWTRLPLGPTNRCLMSNGSDAVWNTCLYTAFPAGSVPYVDANGNLAQNSSRLAWDNTNRRLSVGNNVGAATLYVWDSLAATGSTELTVRAGQGQGSAPLERWLDASGNTLARVGSDGRVLGAGFRAASTGTAAAWQDAGSASDPAGRSDGDAWFNTSSLARKTVEGGQVHTSAQVLCSAAGAGTSATMPTALGSCTIPGGFLKPGDRVEIRFDYSHEGVEAGFAFTVRWGETTLAARTATADETAASGRADAGIHSSGAQWSARSWGSVLSFAASAGAAPDSLAAAITVTFQGRMTSATAETVTLRNFTVLRYPAQANP